MRTRVLVCASLLLLSCVKRVAPSALEDRTAQSGVPLSFGSPLELPQGAQIIWSFGDGTAPATGAQVQHAFPRAGTFEVSQTVQDSDGKTRTVSAHVTVLRRSVPSAVPRDVRAALMMEYPWNRVALHREVAGRLALGDFFDETARTFRDAMGFDPLDAEQARANGFDPDEGVAVFTVPADAEGMIAVVGTLDDAKSLAAVRRLLESNRGAARRLGGPFALHEEKLAEGTTVLVGVHDVEKVAVVQRYGYLYLRMPAATDPLAALKGVLELPHDKGLEQDATYQSIVKRVGPGDVLFYSAPPAEGDRALAATPEEGRARFRGQFGASAFALSEQHDRLQLSLFTQPRNIEPKALQEALTAQRPPPDIAARLPAGAALYVRLSASPATLWREIVRQSAPEAARTRERIQEVLGLDLEKDLLPSFTGNGGIAVYLDAASLLDAILGEQVASFDRSTFVGAGEIEPGKAEALQAAFDRAAANAAKGKVERIPLAGGGTFWRLAEGGLMGAVSNGYLYVALGGPQQKSQEDALPVPPPPKGKSKAKAAAEPVKPLAQALGPLAAVLLPDASTPSLGELLRTGGVGGLEVANQQVAWLDIAGIVRSVEKAASDQGGVVGAGARLLAERAAGLRDALLQMRAAPGGLEAELFLRFPTALSETAAAEAK